MKTLNFPSNFYLRKLHVHIGKLTDFYVHDNEQRQNFAFSLFFNLTSTVQTPHEVNPLELCQILSCHQNADFSALRTDHSHFELNVLSKDNRTILL